MGKEMLTSFYTDGELREIGLKSMGNNVKISRKASIYSPGDISIGDNVRIDDFCILSGIICIGSFVHIAAGCLLFGGKYGITFEDYSGISSRCSIYAESDDYSGLYLTNPTVPMECRHIVGGSVIFKKHSILGSGCTVLPNVVVEEGVAVGSMSLVNKSLEPWGIYAGIPCKLMKSRRKDLLSFLD